MKTFALVLLLATFGFYAFSPDGGGVYPDGYAESVYDGDEVYTRSAQIIKEAEYRANLYGRLSFDCESGYGGYMAVAKQLGVKLQWQDTTCHVSGRELWGWSNIGVITMCRPLSDEGAERTFWHEVGHVLFHCGKPIQSQENYREQTEPEANLFADEMLRLLHSPGQ
ncbi:ImmA/IrrE family metallo-endopeptidase [Lewinella sp. W8]|uniref:ImmA/IrrE family metallo-endopeptidase n=1 Tax=Lewinella sp. W8 TaxID=2528208 RepID=UPI0010679C09|nr:hypothetical protein [Lewinella sp. W8]MTB53064.1 hypothetical protein [Lewinella sp. W8]